MNCLVKALADSQGVSCQLRREFAAPAVKDEPCWNGARDALSELFHLRVKLGRFLVSDDLIIEETIDLLVHCFGIQGDQRLFEDLVIANGVSRFPGDGADLGRSFSWNATEEDDALVLVGGDVLSLEHQFQHLEPCLRVCWHPGWGLKVCQFGASWWVGHCWRVDSGVKNSLWVIANVMFAAVNREVVNTDEPKQSVVC